MLISQRASSDSRVRHGCLQRSFAELRSQLARPSQLNDGHRQRLRDLAQRVARVQALGGQYRRVSLSDGVMAAMDQIAAAV